jgi:hypothetical protein
LQSRGKVGIGRSLDYIEGTAKSSYQLNPPKGAFEYLLMNGSVLVIFDGLDEMLDTARRREISDDVESFSTRFPSTPILVTSREVGYDQAPLDEDRFQRFNLAPFREPQVEEYARKWFAADPDLLSAQKSERAAAFIRDSELVSDLRTNALMLALMCSIYRGENYIPRNRPDVYEKCALMLFDQWDRHRAIDVSLAIEYHLFPAMQYLAHWIYSDAQLQSGVTEQQLVDRAVRYLVPRRFEDQVEARAAAKEFIEFCRGRAWVFTDTGTTPSGENLYQFTHRTFLEYFAANYIVHTTATSAALLKELQPRVLREEWDVVAQLAFQIKSKSLDGAADELLSTLVDASLRAQRPRRTNGLSFAARCLGFLVPSPRVTRTIAEAVWAETMRWGRAHAKRRNAAGGSSEFFGRPELKGFVGDLLSCARENRDPIRAVVTDEALRSLVADNGDGDIAAGLLLDLGFFSGLGRYADPGPDTYAFAYSITDFVLDTAWDEFERRAQSDFNVAFELVMRGRLKLEQYLKWHRFSTLFARRDAFLMRWPSAAESLASEWIHHQSHEGAGLDGPVKEAMKALSGAMLQQPRPWPRARELERLLRQGYYFPDTERRRKVEASDVTFAAFGLIAGTFEAAAGAPDGLESDRYLVGVLPSRIDEAFAPIIRARLTGDLDGLDRAIAASGLESEHAAFARAWARKDFDLVVRRS